MLRWRGKMYGRAVAGHVQGGVIFGPLEVVSLVEALVAGGIRVGIGAWSGPASLTDAMAARATIGAVLDDTAVVFEGWPVVVQAVPAGAEG